ncbi:MAG: hypothetical protein PHO66_00545 [Eubacteriales bacterium]|nr:hypothetical protein [Eubacteriales bacterium]
MEPVNAFADKEQDPHTGNAHIFSFVSHLAAGPKAGALYAPAPIKNEFLRRAPAVKIRHGSRPMSSNKIFFQNFLFLFADKATAVYYK